nr:coproporphyrinogen III oxidase [Pedobacter panaciterrae]
MKKLILSLAFAGSVIIATSACNSTKNMSGTADSTAIDTTMKSVDTSKTMPADTTKLPPDTTVKPAP